MVFCLIITSVFRTSGVAPVLSFTPHMYYSKCLLIFCLYLQEMLYRHRRQFDRFIANICKISVCLVSLLQNRLNIESVHIRGYCKTALASWPDSKVAVRYANHVVQHRSWSHFTKALVSSNRDKQCDRIGLFLKDLCDKLAIKFGDFLRYFEKRHCLSNGSFV